MNDPERQNDRQEAHGVRVKAAGGAEIFIAQGPRHRADHAGHIELGGVERNRIRQVLPLGDVGHHRLVHRPGDRLGKSRAKGQNENFPDADHMQLGE